jgi:hypothetical protein
MDFNLYCRENPFNQCHPRAIITLLKRKKETKNAQRTVLCIKTKPDTIINLSGYFFATDYTDLK